MNTLLHITNGDYTTQKLQELNIKGEIITWREMLCEGKTITEVGSEVFWKTRFDFLQTSYKISKKKFIDFTLKEYRNLCQQKKQDEIVLWFNNDLFCQVNMMAVVSWLKRYRPGRKITIINSEKATTKSSKKKAFSELTTNQLSNLYNNRITLNKDDIEYADYIWQLYCSDSPLRLQTVHKFNTNSPFFNIEQTIKTHLLRFPSLENGLNFIEKNILTISQENQFKNKEALVNSLLKNQKKYGFGDIQYINKLNDLKKLFSSFNPVKVSKIGKQVLENQINYYGKIRNDFSYLGGSKKYSYLYINANDKLLKISS